MDQAVQLHKQGSSSFWDWVPTVDCPGRKEGRDLGGGENTMSMVGSRKQSWARLFCVSVFRYFYLFYGTGPEENDLEQYSVSTLVSKIASLQRNYFWGFDLVSTCDLEILM